MQQSGVLGGELPEQLAAEQGQNGAHTQHRETFRGIIANHGWSHI